MYYPLQQITRSDILQGKALFRGVTHLLTEGQKEKKEKKKKIINREKENKKIRIEIIEGLSVPPYLQP